MMIPRFLRPLLLVFVAFVGLNGCADDLQLGSTEQHIDPPATVTATAISDTRIQVSWSSQAAMGAVKYYIERATAAAGPYTYAGSALEPTTDFVVVNLTPATTYFFRIIAVHGDGSESIPSSSASAMTFGAPGTGNPPTNVVATAISTSRIQITWTAAPTAFKYYILRATAAAGPYANVGTSVSPTTDFLDINLQPATTYFYEVVAVFPDNSESGPSTPPASATTFGATGAPTGVMAQAISEDRIVVSWNAVANAAKYYIYRSSSSSGPFTNIGTTLAPGTSFLDVGLSPSTTYWYTVSAVDGADVESAQSSPPVSATTFPPGGGVFEGYWKFDERTGSIAGDSSGFGRSGTLSGGAAFNTSDKAQIDDNRSVLSISAASSSVVTVPNAFGLNLTGSFTVAFWAKAGAGAQVRFLGMRASGCGAPGWEIGQAGGGLYFQGENETLQFGQSLPADTWTHVAATHAGGMMRLYVNGVQVASGQYTSTNAVQGSLEWGHPGGCAGDAFLIDETEIYSRELTAQDLATLGTLPPAPTGLTVTAKTSQSITLSWSPVPGATSYILSKGTGAGPVTFYSHVPASATYEVDHLTPGTSYTFNVRAVVNGLYSNPSTNVTDTTDGTLSAPIGVTATVISADRISVTWSAVSGAVKYYIFESVGGGPFVYRGSAVGATDFLAVNLQPATTYSYQIQAEDAAQLTSPMSASASATTP